MINMKLLYFVLRIESLLLLIIYPFVALASLMSLAAQGDGVPSDFNYFDILMINAFLWLTLAYPASIIVTEIMNRPIAKAADWQKAVKVQLIPIIYQVICLFLVLYWATLEASY